MTAIIPKETILFVGAGVSMGLGLPSWGKLIDEIGRQLDFDPEVFRVLGTPLSLAEYYALMQGSIGSLRSWMDVEWHNSSINIAASIPHQAIATAGFHKIYTTNFDRWIELSCKHWGIKFHKILTANDMASNKNGSLEIVKFHGDFDDDNSLVLTESSYFERLDFESPLDLMLRADVLRYPTLFVGYSLADINVRYLFHRLSKAWASTKVASARPPSYIFMAKPNPVEEKLFENWGIKPIVAETADVTEALGTFLMSLVAK